MANINDLPKNVHDRLEYLEFMLRFRGWISRVDLTDRFGLGEAAATRDFRLYRDLAECNMSLNQSSKKYELVESQFKPLFVLTTRSALAKLRNTKFCEALGMADFDGVLCPPRLSMPDINILSMITRAISTGSLLCVEYFTVEKGRSIKKLIPHAIFDNGIHWYMRAQDSLDGSFKSYVLTRLVDAQIDHEYGSNPEIKSKDFQWSRMVQLELIPHPNKKNVKCPETISHDFRMEDGCLKIMVRATVAGYWLHYWNVDCTEKHSLEGYEYQLWLRNHNTLYDVDSRRIAPGLSDYKYSK